MVRLRGGQSRYIRDLLAKMNDLRLMKESSDFTIIIENRPIYAHKAVLSAASPYFCAMITGDYREAKESQVVINGLDYDSVDALIKFLYIGEITISQNNIETLFEAANFMEISVKLADIVATFIDSSRIHQGANNSSENFDPAHCVCTLLVIAEKYSLPKLSQAVEDYILGNFIDICDEQMAKLSEAHLETFLQSSDICNILEIKLFETVKKWICKHGTKYLHSLMRHIRFAQIDLMSLARISQDPMIKSDETCSRYIEEARAFLTCQFNMENSSNKTIFFPRCTSECIYTFGGYSPIQPTRQYDASIDEWNETDMAIVRRGKFGVAVWDNNIYFVGGTLDGSVASDYVAQYNPHSNMTTTEVPLPVAKYDVGVSVLGQYLYVIGGFNGMITFNNVDRYDPILKEWKSCPPLSDVKSEMGVVTLGDYIYVIGGWQDSVNRAFDNVERYNPLSLDAWEPVAPMHSRRSSPGCTVFNGRIYVAGGFDGHRYLDSGEVYDPELNAWTEIPRMSLERNRLSLVALDELIYALGGENGTRSNRVESYNPHKREWVAHTPINIGFYSKAVAFKGLKIIADHDI